MSNSLAIRILFTFLSDNLAYSSILIEVIYLSHMIYFDIIYVIMIIFF